MNFATIPNWNSQGVLPTVNGESPTSRNRSPYRVSVLDLVQRFSTSPERRAILKGFLDHRNELHKIGILSGFQWLDGSFLENIELIEQRAPNDLDVVTFFKSPTDNGSIAETNDLFDNKKAKLKFRVDAYFVGLDELSKIQLIQHSNYWYSVWSHRRNLQWKGFIEVDLASNEDQAAFSQLELFAKQGGLA